MIHQIVEIVGERKKIYKHKFIKSLVMKKGGTTCNTNYFN